MSLRFNKEMDEQEAFQMSALQLAYLGDSVWEMIVRYNLILQKFNVHHLHTESIKRVNACAQAKTLACISNFLTEKETEIVRRGRNAHPKHTVPKNQQPEDYAASTGLEALFGYLYLTGQDERIGTIIEIINIQENQHG